MHCAIIKGYEEKENHVSYRAARFFDTQGKMYVSVLVQSYPEQNGFRRDKMDLEV